MRALSLSWPFLTPPPLPQPPHPASSSTNSNIPTAKICSPILDATIATPSVLLGSSFLLHFTSKCLFNSVEKEKKRGKREREKEREREIYMYIWWIWCNNIEVAPCSFSAVNWVELLNYSRVEMQPTDLLVSSDNSRARPITWLCESNSLHPCTSRYANSAKKRLPSFPPWLSHPGFPTLAFPPWLSLPSPSQQEEREREGGREKNPTTVATTTTTTEIEKEEEEEEDDDDDDEEETENPEWNERWRKNQTKDKHKMWSH